MGVELEVQDEECSAPTKLEEGEHEEVEDS